MFYEAAAWYTGRVSTGWACLKKFFPFSGSLVLNENISCGDLWAFILSAPNYSDLSVLMEKVYFVVHQRNIFCFIDICPPVRDSSCIYNIKCHGGCDLSGKPPECILRSWSLVRWYSRKCLGTGARENCLETHPPFTTCVLCVKEFTVSPSEKCG